MSCRPVYGLCCRPKPRPRRHTGSTQSATSNTYLSAPGGLALVSIGKLTHRTREAEEAPSESQEQDDFLAEDRCHQALMSCMRHESSTFDGIIEDRDLGYESASQSDEEDSAGEQGICNWAQEAEPERPWLDHDSWETGVSLPGVTVVTSVSSRGNKVPGQIWEVIPHVASVVSLSSEDSSGSESWEQVIESEAVDLEWDRVSDDGSVSTEEESWAVLPHLDAGLY